MMSWTWFDLHWSWIGLGLSATLLVLLFATDILRSDLTRSRWHDPVWLAWLAPASYMIHQFEEYGIDALGQRFAFPDALCASVGMPPYPACSLPEAVFVAVNIPAIWVAGLICALLARKHPFVGLGLYAIHFTNALSHIGVMIVSGSYNPGVVTATLVLLPLSLWVGHACFGANRMRPRGLPIIVGAGTALSLVLIGSMNLFAMGYISRFQLLMIQVLNPLWVILVPWLSERSVIRDIQGVRK